MDLGQVNPNSYDIKRADCGCYVFKVWRMGRTGHVCRREAGVFFYCRPDAGFYGPLAVYNEVHLKNPFLTHKGWGPTAWAIAPVAFKNFMRVWKGERTEAAYAAAYHVDCAVTYYFRTRGYDGVVYSAFSGRVVELVQL